MLEMADPPVNVSLAAALHQLLDNATGGAAGSRALEALCGGLANLARVPEQRRFLATPGGPLCPKAPGALLLRVAAGGIGQKKIAGLSAAARAHALAALLNGSSGAEGEPLRELLYVEGGLLVALALLKSYSGGKNALLWTRGAALLGRIAGVEAAALALSSASPLRHLSAQIEDCAAQVSAGADAAAVAPHLDGANHLVRALALALTYASRRGQAIEGLDALVPALIKLLPAPALDPMVSAVSANSVALPPASGRFPAALVAHACKALSVALTTSKSGSTARAFLERGGVDRTVCAFANYGGGDAADLSARRNAAILLAKAVQIDDALKARARDLRGMEMLVELGGRFA
mmetsp:Transcript_3712/g.10650  ORF Transcript_3712/g.10650 Transcript_3712/m.10650 type:complete len:350 (-) Transcript_3712:278-1327(-)